MKFKDREIEYRLDKSKDFIKIENEINSLYKEAEFENKVMDEFYEKIFYPHYQDNKKIEDDKKSNQHQKNVPYFLRLDFKRNTMSFVGFRNHYVIDKFLFDECLWEKSISFFNELKKNKENAAFLLNKTHIYSYIYLSRLDNPFNFLINEDDILFDEKCKEYIQTKLKKHIDLLNHPDDFVINTVSSDTSVTEPYFNIRYCGRSLLTMKYQKVKNKEELILLISRLKQEIEYRLYHNKIFKKLNRK